MIFVVYINNEGETMKQKSNLKELPILKRSCLFKFMLSDQMILAVIIYLKSLLKESLVLNVNFFVLNSEVNPEHLSDKDMVLDV